MDDLKAKVETVSATSYRVYLDACRSEYLSQESQDRDHSLKAIGIAAFSVAVFGATQSLLANTDPMVRTTMWVALVGVIGFSLLIVTKSGAWRRPFDVEEVGDSLAVHSADEIEEGLAQAYAEAVMANWKVLDSKLRYLRLEAYCAFVQFSMNAISIYFPSGPS